MVRQGMHEIDQEVAHFARFEELCKMVRIISESNSRNGACNLVTFFILESRDPTNQLNPKGPR